MLCVLSLAPPRFSATPLAPLSRSRPKSPMVEIAECTAAPTSTHTAIQTPTRMSLTNCATSRAGVVA